MSRNEPSSNPSSVESKIRRWRGRIVLIGFGLAALILILTPVIVRWEVLQDACPRQTVEEGYFPDGMYWRIQRAQCGGSIGTVWQVHISASDTQPRLAFDAQNEPVPKRIEQQEDGSVVIRLDRPPEGTNDASVKIDIVPKMRPKRALHFVNGRLRN